MKKIIMLLVVMFLNINVFASTSSDSCHGAEGLWMGKFSYKDPALCELGKPELCDKVSMAIGLKYLKTEDLFEADLYPQRGVASSIKLSCDNGQLHTLPNDPHIPPQTTISFNCDELDNCVVNYEDFRLKAMLIKMWKEDIRF